VCDVAADRVISSRDVIPALDGAPGITREAFTSMCNRVGGFVEVHPHCGGANSCGGFSFDETTGVFSEHNCAGLNTCTGYTCVVP